MRKRSDQASKDVDRSENVFVDQAADSSVVELDNVHRVAEIVVPATRAMGKGSVNTNVQNCGRELLCHVMLLVFLSVCLSLSLFVYFTHGISRL